LDGISFGADTFFLKQDAIGLIVFEEKSGEFSSATVGFRRIGETNKYSTTLNHVHLVDGQRVQHQLNCIVEK